MGVHSGLLFYSIAYHHMTTIKRLSHKQKEKIARANRYVQYLKGGLKSLPSYAFDNGKILHALDLLSQVQTVLKSAKGIK